MLLITQLISHDKEMGGWSPLGGSQLRFVRPENIFYEGKQVIFHPGYVLPSNNQFNEALFDSTSENSVAKLKKPLRCLRGHDLTEKVQAYLVSRLSLKPAQPNSFISLSPRWQWVIGRRKKFEASSAVT